MKTNSRHPKRLTEAKTSRTAKRNGDSRASCSAWAAIWRSANKMDGETRHIIHRGLLPAIFKTRKQTVDFIEKEYGYIRTRPDLKSEPHGWRIPKPVRVTITPNVSDQRLGSRKMSRCAVELQSAT